MEKRNKGVPNGAHIKKYKKDTKKITQIITIMEIITIAEIVTITEIIRITVPGLTNSSQNITLRYW
jgi:hypothetical protein